jgi:hypothetical protein
MNFRLPGGVRRDPAVEVWMHERTGALGAIAQEWYELMRGTGDDVRELMHDGCPVVCVDDAPFGYVDEFKAHVNVGFFHGATLPDPAGLLVGSGKYMRHVTLKPGVVSDSTALRRLVSVAYSDIKTRLAHELP